ncbi:DUF4128 domain-containing protein [Caldimonas brevitalea]|uniref:DUF4128 domain-containing protein n=1 Tax=Caldimonas brevitalea TaxID=413882 RepID=A0A0G3BQP0_9BURK|nr:DUF4128 domain-containing protein [Caldimonas brevitalea]AKJ28840.1 hypothetical protein AAW51_2149 [Caldimonas brevitalea]
MSQALIRQAFETRLKTWADAQAPAIPIAWQNVTMTPPAGRYLRAFLLPASTGSDDLAGEHRVFRGLFQVTVVTPIGTGPGQAEQLAGQLDLLFPLTEPLAVGGLLVYLTSPMSAGPAIQEPDRYAVPVSAGYRADTI